MIRTKVLGVTDGGAQVTQTEMPNGDVLTTSHDEGGMLVSAIFDEWNAYGRKSPRSPTMITGAA